MTVNSDYFRSQDGLKIHYRHWEVDTPKKMVCIVHGLGEHSGRYRHVAEFFESHDITTFALDLRGHGLSEGKRGHAESLDMLICDIEELMKKARVIYNDIPMILFGHSMGGNIVANLITQKPTKEIAAFILSAPWLKLAFTPPAWKLKLGKLVSGILPSLTQPNDLNASFLSKDPKEVAAYENDPLVHNYISAGLFTLITAAGKSLLKDYQIKTKGLCYHGLADQVIDSSTTKKFAELNSLDWKGYENVYHEPHNDLEKHQVLNDVYDWISKI